MHVMRARLLDELEILRRLFDDFQDLSEKKYKKLRHNWKYFRYLIILSNLIYFMRINTNYPWDYRKFSA